MTGTLRRVLKRLSESQRSKVILDQLRELRDVQFEGNLTATAKALRVAPPFLSNLLSGKRGYGLKIIDAIARVTGKSVAEVLHEQEPRWREAEGWEAAIGAARAQMPMVRDEAWEWLGSLSGPLPASLDPGALGLIALAWDQARMKSAAAESAPTKPRRKAATPPGATGTDGG